MANVCKKYSWVYLFFARDLESFKNLAQLVVEVKKM